MNRKADKQNMFDILRKLPAQFEAASRLKVPKVNAKKIVIAGMGGSGIGGDILQSYLRNEIRIPITVVKDYNLPGFVDSNTLVITNSYSGNTEEIVSIYKQGRERKAKIVCISTGGILGKLCKRDRVPLIKIPTGMPPRAAIAYSFVPILLIVQKMGLISNKGKDIRETIAVLSKMSKELARENNPAMRLAKKIRSSIPVIYASGKLYPVAYRWTTEFNENSKCLAYARAFPEQNHNEINALPNAWMVS